MAKRIRVFLDANSLISAVLFDGVYRKALRLAIEKEFDLITTQYVIEEITVVLERKFPHAVNEVKAMLALIDLKIIPVPTEKSCAEFKELIRDPKDVPVLPAALQAKANVLLTGDGDFRSDEITNLIQILDAPAFIRLFKGNVM